MLFYSLVAGTRARTFARKYATPPCRKPMADGGNVIGNIDDYGYLKRALTNGAFRTGRRRTPIWRA